MVRVKWGGRFKKALLVGLVVLFVLTPVFGLKSARAESGTRLYWTDTELAALKTRTGEAVYQNIKAWGDAHKNDVPPTEPTAGSWGGWNDAGNLA